MSADVGELRAIERRLHDAALLLELGDAETADLPRLSRELSEAAKLNGAGPAESGDASFALDLDEFIATKEDSPRPLVGTEDDNILPAYGLGIEVGKGGKGKTTLTIEMALHLASGKDWLGFKVERPLRILFIENEGPREPFRRKLQRKRESWPHEIRGGIFVYTESWGTARLDEAGFVARLNRFVTEQVIDLIIGDPLDSLGMEGEGSPSETRAMVDRFKAAGLFSSAAWWVLTHARKEKVEDAIDAVSGAWGGKPDTMLGLTKEPGNRARLSFHKLRYGRRDGFTYTLAYDPETESFTFVKEEESERDLVSEITEWLTPRPHRTSREIAESKEPKDPEVEPGIGANRHAVEDVLEGNPGRFTTLEGKAVGKPRKKTVWKVGQPSDPPDPPDPPSCSQWAGEGKWVGGSGVVGPTNPDPAHLHQPELAQEPDPPDPTERDDVPTEGELLSITYLTKEEAAAHAPSYGPGAEVRPHESGFALFAIDDDGGPT